MWVLLAIWHGIQHFTLGDIPWWFYVVASFAAAGVIIVEVPGRLGLVLGLLAALVLGDIGWEAHGYQLGAAARDAWWTKQAATEQKRLQEGFAAVLQSETARADRAEKDNKNLQERVTRAESATPDANGNPTAVPADIARRLYDIAGEAGGRPHGPTRRAFGPFPLPGMLRLHR